MSVDKYYHVSDIITEVLVENRDLSDRWLEYIKKNYKKKNKFHLGTFILDFIRDFKLIDDLKEYIQTSLEICLDNEELIVKNKGSE